MEALIRTMEEEMMHTGSSIKEEKQKLQSMKKMKDDAKKMTEWQSEIDELRNKKNTFQEALKQARLSPSCRRLLCAWQRAASLRGGEACAK